VSGGTDDVRNKLAQLAERYLKRTAGEVAMLREHLERARSGHAEGYAELRNLAHRMNGTGSTLGFADIGDEAAKIESLARSGGADSLPPVPAIPIRIKLK
jgi:hypothetical protein